MSLSKFETDKHEQGGNMIRQVEEEVDNGNLIDDNVISSKLFHAYLCRYFICGTQREPNQIPEPFIKAAEMQNMKHVRMFMNANGFNIDLYGRDGRGLPNWTALLSCVKLGHSDMVEFLLKNGADPKLCLRGEVHSKNNALHMAIQAYDGNDLSIIKSVLTRIGAGINATIWNRYGKLVTPLDMLLYHRSLNGNSDLIKDVTDLGGVRAEMVPPNRQ